MTGKSSKRLEKKKPQIRRYIRIKLLSNKEIKRKNKLKEVPQNYKETAENPTIQRDLNLVRLYAPYLQFDNVCLGELYRAR